MCEIKRFQLSQLCMRYIHKQYVRTYKHTLMFYLKYTLVSEFIVLITF